MKRYIIITLAVIAIIAIVAGIYIYPFFFNKNEKETIFYVYPNMSNEALTDSLKTHLGEDFGGKTAQMLDFLDAKMQNRTGAYKVTTGLSPYHTARLLQRGGQTGIKFSYNYIRTVEQFAEHVSRRLINIEKDSLLNLLKDKEFCKKYGKTPETIVSIFQPDTYEYYWTVSPEDFIEVQYSYYNKFWNDERKAKAESIGLSIDEVVTLCSIVEEEIAKRDEAGKVARLYLNRINKGILLQADPTVKFAIGDFSLRRIYNYMLKIDSPYNTYLYKGLPPGPIRFVKKHTIDAALEAPMHPYIYMCAKEDFSGYHNFTASYSEHIANARRYQRELNRRGIKK